jgi:two-component system, NtrC family, response regulator HydG
VNASRPLLLLIDDQPRTSRLIERAAGGTGYNVISQSSARDALAALPTIPADVALIDLDMPELGGLHVLRAVRQSQPQCAVILMTAQASHDGAIEAVKLGALDYLTKPVDAARLLELLAGVREEIARRRELLITEHTTAHRLELCGMIGRSAVMQQLFTLTRRVAPHARQVLITGESGAGKKGLARALHSLGPLRARPFVSLARTAAIDTQFAAAGGGTLFLAEVGELAPAVQASLLRLIETGAVSRGSGAQPTAVDVRIVAATSRDLGAAAGAGGLRSDLFTRLSIVELHVPALRERREDIPYLTAAFVKEFSDRLDKVIDGLTPPAERILMSAAWPGNVRELRSVLDQACRLAEGTMLTEREIAAVMPAPREAAPAAAPVPSGPSQALDIIERDHIMRVLAEVRGNKLVAAKRLGISRRTLYRRLERHGLMVSIH